MKILILMPLDEKWSFIASGIYKNLDDNAKDKAFVMPMFTEWQLATKKMVIGNDLPQNWSIATFGSIIKAKASKPKASSTNLSNLSKSSSTFIFLSFLKKNFLFCQKFQVVIL